VSARFSLAAGGESSMTLGTPPMDRRVEAAISIMHQSLTKEWSTSVLSRRVNLSPVRLRELFKRDTGRSPARYLRDLRMSRANDLLQSTFLSIKEITVHIGIRNVGHFIREFKKRNGVTPSAFRSRSRGSLEMDSSE
jgi:transcriptional regulator GlxA family with amidase domain